MKNIVIEYYVVAMCLEATEAKKHKKKVVSFFGGSFDLTSPVRIPGYAPGYVVGPRSMQCQEKCGEMVCAVVRGMHRREECSAIVCQFYQVL